MSDPPPQTRAPHGLGARLALVALALPLAVLAEVSIALFVIWIVGVSTLFVGVGIALLLAAMLGTRLVAGLHRQYASRVLAVPIARPYLRSAPGAGPVRRLSTVLTDPASWRDWAWLLVNATVGFALQILTFTLFIAGVFYLIYPFLWAVTPRQVFSSPFGFYTINHLADALVLVPIGLFFLSLWWLTALPIARGYARLAVSLLAPTKGSALRARVSQLTTSRAETVDTQAAELRRIERDLHDGAQARLVSLGMSLGLAEELLARDPEAARSLLAEARAATTSALAELRDLVRGIHPPVLADRGLDGAVRALALASPLPTTVSVALPGRLPAPVESAGYFAVAECLTNAIKHSRARSIAIDIGHADGRLQLRVRDDGQGGASLAGGTGLSGIQRRLAAFDGQLSLESPPGGPTEVRMSLPCELSSPRTSPSSGTA
ncbi:sensor histidine kinase [Jatrophihabitans telluris]|uniref:histidine kinase n=1 Tax=Jatrophihabitans telluris TaxID=2038343 RepID=A0ABY4R206_9ACTN|nr:sensor histidine kinase [Jatrophihabitans telluris]UQX89770.1 sensor histidine kinase [Jatrophihabitans telluris]